MTKDSNVTQAGKDAARDFYEGPCTEAMLAICFDRHRQEAIAPYVEALREAREVISDNNPQEYAREGGGSWGLHDELLATIDNLLESKQ